ncbi:cytochrome c oxidase subunit cyclope [Megachile rotundata]|uniref:cytochrome c oxidase subunit cyclope n=1 Tax=Megachile rotundata TaxID=143995 RepID=UPI000258EA01|nr:PREDICTED: cytochrome c oxidase subunit 6C [Megachile rotundata]XP_012146303.1 PREDICTED: cytochrome c oxidase subunit 6C [Megachile rotundata]
MPEGRIPKPELRNLHLAYVKKGLTSMIGFTALVGLTYKIFVIDSYERKMTEFYKNYDPEKSFQRMVDAGLMQSAGGGN